MEKEVRGCDGHVRYPGFANVHTANLFLWIWLIIHIYLQKKQSEILFCLVYFGMLQYLTALTQLAIAKTLISGACGFVACILFINDIKNNNLITIIMKSLSSPAVQVQTVS